MKLNTTRIWLGGIVGGVAWIAWGFLIGMRLAPFYAAMQSRGLFLKEYAWARATAGPGLRTALKVGMIVGFCAGVPSNFAQAAWSPVPRVMPLGWMLDLWGGAILAAIIAGSFYKE